MSKRPVKLFFGLADWEEGPGVELVFGNSFGLPPEELEGDVRERDTWNTMVN